MEFSNSTIDLYLDYASSLTILDKLYNNILENIIDKNNLNYQQANMDFVPICPPHMHWLT